MCTSFLGCVLLDPTKSRSRVQPSSKEYAPPPRQPVSRSLGLAVQKLEREREKSMSVKPPTQRVMGCRASTALMTLLHTWYATPTFWCHPYAPEPLCAETPDCLEPGRTYRLWQIPEPGEGSNVQLFSWLCFIGPYQVTKQGYNPPLQKIPPRQPVSRSFGLAVQKLEREKSMSVKPQHKE